MEKEIKKRFLELAFQFDLETGNTEKVLGKIHSELSEKQISEVNELIGDKKQQNEYLYEALMFAQNCYNNIDIVVSALDEQKRRIMALDLQQLNFESETYGSSLEVAARNMMISFLSKKFGRNFPTETLHFNEEILKLFLPVNEDDLVKFVLQQYQTLETYNHDLASLVFKIITIRLWLSGAQNKDNLFDKYVKPFEEEIKENSFKQTILSFINAPITPITDDKRELLLQLLSSGIFKDTLRVSPNMCVNVLEYINYYYDILYPRKYAEIFSEFIAPNNYPLTEDESEFVNRNFKIFLCEMALLPEIKKKRYTGNFAYARVISMVPNVELKNNFMKLDILNRFISFYKDAGNSSRKLFDSEISKEEFLKNLSFRSVLKVIRKILSIR